MQLISLGFQPKAGNQLTLVTAGGAVSGRFAQFVDPFATGPGFNTVDLVYGRNSVLLEFLNSVAIRSQPGQFQRHRHLPHSRSLLTSWRRRTCSMRCNWIQERRI